MITLFTAFAVVGCSSSSDEDNYVEPKIPEVSFPASPTYPTELLGVWKLKSGDSMEFAKNGVCKVKTKVMVPGGTNVDPIQVIDGKWGVEGTNCFIKLASERVIDYSYSLKDNTLELTKNKVKLSYSK
jgi:hypothetical protein